MSREHDRYHHPEHRMLGLVVRELDGELHLARTYLLRGQVRWSPWEDVSALDVTTAMLDGVLELLCIARPTRRLTVYVPDLVAHAVLRGRSMRLTSESRSLLAYIRAEERKLLKRPTYRHGNLPHSRTIAEPWLCTFMEP